MSRCFTFPPPEYVWNGVSGDALIDLLKNLAEKKKNENDERRKKRKREEKAKKREQYKKKMQKHNEIPDKEKSDDVEKSDLTEEHTLPSSPRSLCYTSDGATQSGNGRSKRKRDADDDELPCNANHGNIGQSALILIFKECFWLVACSCAYLGCYYHSIADEELRKTKMAQEDAIYRSLFENLDLIPVQYEVPVDDIDDQKWLFEKKNKDDDDDDAANRLKTTSNNCSFPSGSSAGPPRAHYIEEAGIYALPYTIPF